jgi:hypothetical protein
MKKETYYFEIKDLITQFVAAFNDVVIRRYNNDRAVEDRIHVSFLYSPKTRTLNDLVNQAQHIILPVISVFPTGFTRDPSRVFNKLNGPMYPSLRHKDSYENTLQPVPVNISVGMSIITRVQHDLDQILSNWIPYCDPYIVLSWKMPYTDLELRSHVMWNGSVSINDPKELQHTQPYRWVAETQFIIEGWLFKKPENPAGIIYKIDTDFTAVKDIFQNYDIMSDFESDITTDSFTISARPTITEVSPFLYLPTSGPTKFKILGNMYDYVTNVYVSGTEDVFENTALFYPTSSNPALSANYPPFSGIEILEWSLINNNQIEFIMPSAVSAGKIDIIVLNEAGYGILTQDTYNKIDWDFNPYPEASSGYSIYTPYQPPWINGIDVVYLGS